jgi:membrane-associated phospholipid phosphatase
MLRAVLISARNLGFFLGAVLILREAGTMAEPPVIIAVLLVGALALCSQVWIRDRRGDSINPALLLGLFFLFIGMMAYARAMADQAGFTVQYAYVISSDEAIFFGSVPTVWLQDALHTPGVINVIDVLASLIYFSYFVVPLVVGTVLWHVNPRLFRVYLTTTILMIGVGSALFTLFPTAPPWLAALDGHLPPVFRIAPEVAEIVRPGFYERGYQAVGINDVAAFPSYHTAQTVAVALATWQLGRRLRIVGTLYAVSMGLSLVYLGEHYASDVLAGAALALLGWVAALKLTPRLPAMSAASSPAEPARDQYPPQAA